LATEVIATLGTAGAVNNQVSKAWIATDLSMDAGRIERPWATVMKSSG